MIRRILRTTTAGAAALCALALTGCGAGAPELAADNGFVPEPVGDSMAAGFLTIRNDGDAGDTLTSVSSDAAETVQMHTTEDNAMRQVETFPVPAGGSLEFSRGGNHLMLMGLKRALQEGERISFTLHFEESDPITLEVPVEATTHTGADGHGSDGHGPDSGD